MPGWRRAKLRYASASARTASSRDLPIAAFDNESPSSRNASIPSSRLSAAIPATWLNNDGGLIFRRAASAARVSAAIPLRSAISAAAATTSSRVRPTFGLPPRFEKSDDLIRYHLRLLDMRIVPRAGNHYHPPMQPIGNPSRFRFRIGKVGIGAAHDDERWRMHLADTRLARSLGRPEHRL